MNRLLHITETLVLLAMLVSCVKSGPTAPAHPAAELDFAEEKIPLPDGEYIYRQTISIPRIEDGGELFSWRLETFTGEPLPGTWADGQGWLWFRVPGSDPSIPLNRPGAHRGLWTSQSSLSFDHVSAQGKISNLVIHAEARIRSASGAIETRSSALRSGRLIGSRIAVDFQNGDETGSGIEFWLREVIGDIYVEGLYAGQFMFRVNILDEVLDTVSEGQWHSSLEMADLRRVRLNASSDPPLAANAAGQYTQFECYVVSRLGIEEAARQSVYFRVRSGFRPQAVIFPQTLAALGSYHYSVSHNDPLAGHELIPSTDSRTNRNLWTTDSGYEAINSPDLRLHLQWGFRGQFQAPNPPWPGGPWEGGPFEKEVNICLDADTGANYHSQVAAFDLRLDGAPFPALGQFVAPVQISHGGKSWLRVQNLNSAAKSCILTGLADGDHLFEVCAVDLQGAISDPASVNIRLEPFVPAQQRTGLLIVDDTFDHSSLAPADYVNAFYDNICDLDFIPGGVDLAQAQTETGYPVTVSPVLLQNYLVVVWHSDNPSHAGTLGLNADALEIWLAHQGKLVISHSSQLYNNFEALRLNASGFLAQRLGITGTADYGALSASLATRPFFVRAEGMYTLPDINLMIGNAFNPLVRNYGGLGTVTYFNPGSGLDFSYSFGCKPVDAPVQPPSQDQYDLYSSKYVVYEHTQNDATAVLFGFPLSYMEPDDAQAALWQIINAIMIWNG
ncbi:MAG: hypothetical protein K0B87_02755 [Candidatus Syntrophosphaera sp.]|nr:hypothetical protein [Candidatus Syntrophosphaera sp.]